MGILQNFRNLISPDAIEVAKDISEIALDSVLEDGALKEIPVFGWVISLYKMGSSIRQRHTIKKVAAFLQALENISEEEKFAFEERLKDEDKKGELFETILITLDRLDETLKAEMVGNLFLMYIKHAIKKHEFLRFKDIVSKAFIGDLICLHLRYSFLRSEIVDDRFKEWSDYDTVEFEQNLLTLGLISQTLSTVPSRSAEAAGMRDITEPAIKTEITPSCRTLAALLFYDLEDKFVQDFIKNRKEDNIRNQPTFKTKSKP